MKAMPKRAKHRKWHKGTIRGNATRGHTVEFGEWGLQSLEAGFLSSRVLEAGRVAATRAAPAGRVTCRVFPHKPITKKPAETRMGKGKGEPEYWAAVVKPGMILFEVGGLPEDAAKACMARIAYKMPFKCRFVTRRPSIGG